jgi:hypothetical protein
VLRLLLQLLLFVNFIKTFAAGLGQWLWESALVLVLAA